MHLSDIQESVQQIAEAVSAALKMEVEIADDQLFRVAGTGRAQVDVLRTMAGEDHVYQSALRTGQPIIIQNPGFHEICKPCLHFGNCPETGEICCPIHLDGKGIGVIGLLGFDMEQRKRLFENVEVTMNFLKKMAELIAASLKAHNMFQEQQLVVKQLTTVMNYLDQGVIAVDNDGQIIHMNEQSKRLLQIDAAEQIHDDIKDILLKSTQPASEESVTKEVRLLVGGEHKRFWVSHSPMHVNGQGKGAVITMDDLEKMTLLAMKIQNHEGSDSFSTIIGTSQVVVATKEKARKVATSDSTILIRGESGTGKELFAKAIHFASHRGNNMFMSINCGAIPEHLLESELFGYEEGAFTGAKKGGKAGKIELADKGTLFLDEIGDMPLLLQVKLLRMLQEKQIERIGSIKGAKSVDVRIIAATHQDLEKMVDDRLFREDLYYRLNVIPVAIPPLRDRKDDILLLAYHFLRQYSISLRKQIGGIHEDAKHALLGYRWPGNVRELANAMEYAVNMEMTNRISLDNLPQRIKDTGQRTPYTNTNDMAVNELLNLKEIEKKAIFAALKMVNEHHNPKIKAAELLGISRATLFRKIRLRGQYGNVPPCYLD